MFEVRTGPYISRDAAEADAALIRKLPGYSDARVLATSTPVAAAPAAAAPAAVAPVAAVPQPAPSAAVLLLRQRLSRTFSSLNRPPASIEPAVILGRRDLCRSLEAAGRRTMAHRHLADRGDDAVLLRVHPARRLRQAAARQPRRSRAEPRHSPRRVRHRRGVGADLDLRALGQQALRHGDRDAPRGGSDRALLLHLHRLLARRDVRRRAPDAQRRALLHRRRQRDGTPERPRAGRRLHERGELSGHRGARGAVGLRRPDLLDRVSGRVAGRDVPHRGATAESREVHVCRRRRVSSASGAGTRGGRDRLACRRGVLSDRADGGRGQPDSTAVRTRVRARGDDRRRGDAGLRALRRHDGDDVGADHQGGSAPERRVSARRDGAVAVRIQSARAVQGGGGPVRRRGARRRGGWSRTPSTRCRSDSR